MIEKISKKFVFRRFSSRIPIPHNTIETIVVRNVNHQNSDLVAPPPLVKDLNQTVL